MNELILFKLTCIYISYIFCNCLLCGPFRRHMNSCCFGSVECMFHRSYKVPQCIATERQRMEEWA